MRMRWRFSAVLAALALVGASQAWAVRTSLWTQDTVDDFLAGDVTGVTVTSDGQVQLGAAWDSVVTSLPEVAQIWCLARDSKGQIYFGTGDDGRIYRWVHGRPAQLVWNTGSSEIMSMAIDANDNLYAGTSTDGQIYRVTARGDTSRYFETGEQSVWTLLVGKNGDLYAGTGSRGRVYKITGPGKGEVFAETRDANVLALAWAKDGALLAGTSSKGLLLRIEANGATRVIYDSGAEELRAIAVLDDGSIAVGTNRSPSGSSGGGAGGGGGGSPGGPPLGIEITPSGGAKCGVYLVQPDGSARLLYAPPCDFVYAMVPGDAGSVWFTTGNPAALFRVGLDRKFGLLGATESKQLLALLHVGKEVYAAAGNAAVLYSLGSGVGPEGIYISEAHDLRSVASWGEARVSASGGGEVHWSSRSGFSKTPDDGWSGWSREVPVKGYVKIESPPARFLQYRLRFRRGSGELPTVSTVEVAYLQRNLPPSIANVTLYGPHTGRHYAHRPPPRIPAAANLPVVSKWNQARVLPPALGAASGLRPERRLGARDPKRVLGRGRSERRQSPLQALHQGGRRDRVEVALHRDGRSRVQLGRRVVRERDVPAQAGGERRPRQPGRHGDEGGTGERALCDRQHSSARRGPAHLYPRGKLEGAEHRDRFGARDRRRQQDREDRILGGRVGLEAGVPR